MKNALINIFLLIGSVVVILLLVEGATQIYVYKIAEKGKLFEPDEVTGWRVKSHLDMQRKNADGNIWTIRTDKEGFRRSRNLGSGTKVLILGDSLAFGEGVDVEERFDAQINNHGYSVLNTGVMGYGTDQQFLKAKPYLAKLNKNDIIIVLTYYNDFYDITRKKHSGRAKPWFTIENGTLQLHKPQITLNEALRDKSYIYAKLGSLVTKHHEISASDVEHASKIYQKLIEHLSQQLANRGVRIIVAYHGIPIIKDTEHSNIILKTLNAICDSTDIECINIDQHINNNSQYYLADGHWSKKGHEIVGSLLFKNLSYIARH